MNICITKLGTMTIVIDVVIALEAASNFSAVSSSGIYCGSTYSSAYTNSSDINRLVPLESFGGSRN